MSADNTSALVWLIIGLVILIVHFIPSFIAFSRNHENRQTILILNILFGWTIIGWGVLMIWATNKG